jgi:dephospho-CoA kinase
MIVALTGGIGCGKSEATKIFAELGVPIVDLDVISHELTAVNQPLVSEIVKKFGSAYRTPDGALNRVAMRELIFNNEAARNQLNAITHPAIFAEAAKKLSKLDKSGYTILAIPLLYEGSPYISLVDQVLMIDCNEKTQIERVKIRSQISEAQILQIIHSQSSRNDLLNLADDVIVNNGNVAELRNKIVNQHQKYINTCIVSKTIS